MLKGVKVTLKNIAWQLAVIIKFNEHRLKMINLIQPAQIVMYGPINAFIYYKLISLILLDY